MDALNRLAKLIYLLGLLGSLGLLVYFAALMVGVKAPSNGFWPQSFGHELLGRLQNITITMRTLPL